MFHLFSKNRFNCQIPVFILICNIRLLRILLEFSQLTSLFCANGCLHKIRSIINTKSSFGNISRDVVRSVIS